MEIADIDKLTIGEVRAIVERASAALAAFREAQAMLGAPASSTAPTPPQRPIPTVDWTPAELAQRERLKMKREELPADIAAAMGDT